MQGRRTRGGTPHAQPPPAGLCWLAGGLQCLRSALARGRRSMLACTCVQAHTHACTCAGGPLNLHGRGSCGAAMRLAPPPPGVVWGSCTCTPRHAAAVGAPSCRLHLMRCMALRLSLGTPPPPLGAAPPPRPAPQLPPIRDALPHFRSGRDPHHLLRNQHRPHAEQGGEGEGRRAGRAWARGRLAAAGPVSDWGSKKGIYQGRVPRHGHKPMEPSCACLPRIPACRSQLSKWKKWEREAQTQAHERSGDVPVMQENADRCAFDRLGRGGGKGRAHVKGRGTRGSGTFV